MKRFTASLLTVLMLIPLNLTASAVTYTYKDYDYVFDNFYEAIYNVPELERFVVFNKYNNGSYAIFDYNGRQLCSFIYDYIEIKQVNGYFTAMRSGVPYILDKDGREITKFGKALNYILAEKCVVSFFKDHIEYYDYSGKLLSSWKIPDYDFICNHETYNVFMFKPEGTHMIIMEEKGIVGLGDINGNVIIKPEEGIRFGGRNEKFFTFIKNGKYSIYNTETKKSSGFIYESVELIDGVDSLIVKKDGKFGVTDYDGNILVSLKYENFYEYYDKIMVFELNGVRTGYDCRKNLLLEGGIFNESFKDGNDIWPPMMKLGDFYIVRKGDHYGLADADGNLRLPFEYYRFRDFSEGYAVVTKVIDNKIKYGYINEKAEVVIEPRYDGAADFSEGLAAVDIVNDGNRTTKFINALNTAVITIPGVHYVSASFYHPLTKFKNGIAVISRGWIEREGFDVYDINGGLILKHDERDTFPWYNASEIFYNMMIVSSHVDAHSRGSCNVIKYKGSNPDIKKYYAVGDKVGSILYSDITAKINGKAIPSAVKNGNVLICVEDLESYGFDVKWDNSTRTLDVKRNTGKAFAPVEFTAQRGPVGTFKCWYYYTDIKTYFDGNETECYAVDGRMMIKFDVLNYYGSYTWDGASREIKLDLR